MWILIIVLNFPLLLLPAFLIHAISMRIWRIWSLSWYNISGKSPVWQSIWPSSAVSACRSSWRRRPMTGRTSWGHLLSLADRPFLLRHSPRTTFGRPSGTGRPFLLRPPPRTTFGRPSGTGRPFLFCPLPRTTFGRPSGTGRPFLLRPPPRTTLGRPSGTGRPFLLRRLPLGTTWRIRTGEI